MKKVLIPTDFSKNAWGAISCAIDLFKNEACDFYILNAYDVDNLTVAELTSEAQDKTHLEFVQEHSEVGLKKISQRISFRDESYEHNHFYISRGNDLIGAMKDVIEKKDIDLVIMGTKGKTDDLNIAFGSNALRAMEKIRNSPVLTIPPNIIFKEPNEIVFPTSFKTHFKQRELNYLIDIARITNAPIRILHIQKETALDADQENYKALLEGYFAGLDYSFHFIDNQSLEAAIHSFVQSRNSEMISFLNKKHTFFSSMFSRPLVKSLAVNSDVPILAMHDLRN